MKDKRQLLVGAVVCLFVCVWWHRNAEFYRSRWFWYILRWNACGGRTIDSYWE